MTLKNSQPAKLDPRIGVGLRTPHIDDALTTKNKVGWLEVHAENWMTNEGPIADRLSDIRKQYPLSLHGVGLSLGSATGVSNEHLSKLCKLVESSDPILVSEHLSWGEYGGHHSNDLLPLPFNQEAIETLVRNIDKTQQALGRKILVENISSYWHFSESTMPEWEFVNKVIDSSDCGLLLDLNNLYVNAHNQQFDVNNYLNAIPWSRVGEIHLAGFEQESELLIDTHGQAVQEPVWKLYDYSLKHIPTSARTLIEWDTQLPSFSTLISEAERASTYLLKGIPNAA